jgi:outer membrane protein OmpA-like peptidoglycan-associated protein
MTVSKPDSATAAAVPSVALPDKESPPPPVQAIPPVVPGPADSIGAGGAASAQPDSTAPAPPVPAVRPLILKAVHFAVDRARLTQASSATLSEVVASLRLHPEARIEVGGHTDATGRRGYNRWLSLERARAVVHFLIQAGIDSSRLEAHGYGPDRPVASNGNAAGRARNRRTELKVLRGDRPGASGIRRTADSIRGELLASASIESYFGPIQASAPDPDEPDILRLLDPVRGRSVTYETAIENRYGIPLEGLLVRLPAPLDSAVVLIGDSIVGRGTGAVVTLPAIPPHGSLRIRAWGARQGDSAAAVLEQRGLPLDRAVTAVRDTAAQVERLLPPRFPADSLPSVEAVPDGGMTEVVLAPPETGWPGEAIWRLPPGWEVVSGTVHQGIAMAPDPVPEGDGRGGTILRWPSLASHTDSLTIALRPAGQGPPVEVVSVAMLQGPDQRLAEQRRSLVAGPGVEIFAPGDGAVLRTDRLYIGVRGEASAPVTLFDGDSVLAEASIRIDGVQDFIAVALTPGPHRLRARMKNSWGAERWDSVSVHVTYLPDSFVAAEAPVQLVADGHTQRVVRVRVLDRWGVPVVNGPFVTVRGTGAEPVNQDGDPSSVGLQLKADEAGWISVALRPGTSVRAGRLSLTSGEAKGSVGLDLLPNAGPLFLTGVGRVGVGSSPGNFGALTARGRLDRRTSLTLSYDSRRLNEGRDNFGRSYDPLEEAQYPLLGDAGLQRSLGASRYQLSARVERGYDWLAFGDVSTTGFGEGLRLTSYRRALPGAGGRITSGPVQWQGFFSSTRQSVQQLQLRGAGTSGPYDLVADIAPGTEDVRLESRAPENTQRVISQQGLVRYIDYQIDYERGTLLLKQPVPAMDTFGNPVFIVLTYETKSGGPRRDTWGIRAVGNMGRLLAPHSADSIEVGATMIHDGAGIGARSLSGLDLRLRSRRGLGLNAELSRSVGTDSSGSAASLDGSAELLRGALLVSAGWMRVDGGYRNPANFGIQGGSEEFKLGGRYHAGVADLRLEHEEQRFDVAGVRRSRTVGGLTRSLGSAVQLDALLTDDRGATGGLRDASTAGEGKLSWAALSRLKLWAEGRRQLAQQGNAVRPDYAGVGAAWRLGSGASLEARHRRVFLPNGGATYSVTDFGVRAHVAPGTEAWSSYELAGVNGGQSAALIGLNNHLTLGRSWALNAMLERRVGVGQAAVGDPVRALPFVQVEEDYWSAALGAEFLPQQAPYRLSARGELRNGALRSSRLLTVAGDVSLTSSLALLSRQEFQRSDQRLSTGPLASRQYNSLWGVALRPVHSDRVNLLGKFQWISARNPAGAGLLARQGDESRVIGAVEGIWSPDARSEFALRFAARRTSSTVVTSDSLQRDLTSSGAFIGWRARRDATRKLGVRAEGRMLLERTSATTRWDLAPQLYYLPVPVLEVATGYRLGDLRDPDFAVDGGHGWFLTLGARLTEESLSSAAAFWRQRLGGQ